MTENLQVSPLSEASPASLEEFFSRRPPFDEAALAAIVRELRRMREKWESLGEAERAPAKRAPKASKPASPAQLSADDLWSEETGK